MSARALRLRWSEPLDLDVTLDCGQSFRWRREPDGAWAGVVGDALVRLRRERADLVIESAPTPPAEMAGLLWEYLRMDDDLPAIQRRLARDARVGAAVRAYPGLRVLRQPPWETLASFILSATSNIPRIAGTVERLAAAYGPPVVLDGLTRHAFPSPERLAEVGERPLRALGCGFRAPYLAAAAEAVATGELPLDALRGAPYAELLERLTVLRGVGDKIADCVMLFALDRTEAFPVDRWVHRALRDWYGIDARRYRDARTWARAQFGADAGYANHYLFWRMRSSRPARGRVVPSR